MANVRGDVLEVVCSRADPDVKWRDVEGILSRINERLIMVDDPERAMLLLRRGSNSMLFPLRCMRQWFSNYRLQDYSMSARAGDKESEEIGAAVVLNIGPAPQILREEIR
jgi:hypothetical protein